MEKTTVHSESQLTGQPEVIIANYIKLKNVKDALTELEAVAPSCIREGCDSSGDLAVLARVRFECPVCLESPVTAVSPSVCWAGAPGVILSLSCSLLLLLLLVYTLHWCEKACFSTGSCDL